MSSGKYIHDFVDGHGCLMPIPTMYPPECRSPADAFLISRGISPLITSLHSLSSGIEVINTLMRAQPSGEGVLSLSNSLVGGLQLQHLAARGHRHIGYAAPDDSRLVTFRDRRLDGVRTAAFELGLPEPSVRTVAMDVAAAADAVAAWRAEDPAVTAVCAYNDDLAFALLGGMRSLGLRAPDDIAVVGVDDTPLAPFAKPPLTTVRMDLDAVVAYLTEALVRQIEGGAPPPVPRTEATTLVIRESA